MSQFFETMCARYGVIELIDYHNERLNRTRRELFGCDFPIDLKSIISPDPAEEYLKVRVVYDFGGISDITYQPYTPRQIHTLRIISDNGIDYRYKSTDRTHLEELLSLREECDDVLIVRNGLITDTSYTNVAVNIGGEWLTPRLPLLKGTRRASLLDRGIIREADIRSEEVPNGTELMLFNGMMDFGMCKAVLKR